MKRVFFPIGLCFFFIPVLAQETEQGVDLLKAPTSPASQLLNISPNAIERPTDLSSLWISITNSTNNLSKLPTNYAFDISPAALFGKPISLSELSKTTLKDVLRQSFIVSAGIRTDEDTLNDISFYKSAVGLKVSFVRPRWTKATTEKYTALRELQKKLTDVFIDLETSVLENEPVKSKFDSLPIIARKHGMESTVYKEAEEEANTLYHLQLEIARAADPELNALRENIKLKARDFKIEREGAFLDLAGGLSFQFPTNDLGYSLVDRSGVWLTGGYEGGNKKLSILGIARYLYQPETIFADPTGTIPSKNISTFDVGSRVLYATSNDQFSFSFEAIYRSVLTNSIIIDPSWRLVFSAEYDIGFNQKLSFNFGRDFDGTTQKGGTLIGMLNFITGFGNKRAIK